VIARLVKQGAADKQIQTQTGIGITVAAPGVRLPLRLQGTTNTAKSQAARKTKCLQKGESKSTQFNDSI